MVEVVDLSASYNMGKAILKYFKSWRGVVDTGGGC